MVSKLFHFRVVVGFNECLVKSWAMDNRCRVIFGKNCLTQFFRKSTRRHYFLNVFYHLTPRFPLDER